MARSNHTIQTHELYDGDDISGDGSLLGNRGLGGKDLFLGEDFAGSYQAVGDASEMVGTSRGGSDTFMGGYGVDSIIFVGDGYEMSGSARGGRDFLYGGDDSGNLLMGDGYSMEGKSRGGHDEIYGGDTSLYVGKGSEILLGDAFVFGTLQIDAAAETGSVAVIGGNDLIVAGDVYSYGEDSTSGGPLAAGDAYAMANGSTGGADTLHGGSAYAYASGEDDGGAAVTNIMAGDGLVMTGESSGGSDVLVGGGAYGSWEATGTAVNLLMGDSLTLIGDVANGDDTIVGGNASGVGEDSGPNSLIVQILAGDSLVVVAGPGASMGNDRLMGGDSSGSAVVINVLLGEALTAVVSETPTADAAAGVSALLGDVTADLADGAVDLQWLDLLEIDGVDASEVAPVQVVLGNDTLIGGSGAGQNLLMGDALALSAGIQGGDDIVIAGDITSSFTLTLADAGNLLIGDALVGGGAMGGRDTVVGSSGNDLMIGDFLDKGEDGDGAAADRFVFAYANGEDEIWDFDAGVVRDRINLAGFRGRDDDFNSVRSFLQSGRLQDTEEGVWIDLSVDHQTEGHGILLVGVTVDQLTRENFQV